MTGITDIKVLLRDMKPELTDGEYHFCTVADATLQQVAALDPLCTYRETEGMTLILDRKTALANDLAQGPVMRGITLTVHSSLEAVGLTAAVATALTEAGISANVVAAFFHDHIFVPAVDADQAVAVLLALCKA